MIAYEWLTFILSTEGIVFLFFNKLLSRVNNMLLILNNLMHKFIRKQHIQLVSVTLNNTLWSI